MTLLHMSLTGALMILLIACLRVLLMNKLPKRTFVLLWVLALLRLTVPFSIPVRLPQSVPLVAPTVKSELPFAAQQVRVFVRQNPRFAAWPGGAQEAMAPATEPPTANVMSSPTPPTTRIHWPLALYIIGLLAAAGWLVRSYVSLRIEFSKSRELLHGPAVDFVRAQRLRRGVRVLASKSIRSPVTYGLIRPCILLPEAMLQDPSQLPCVLTHEQTHIRRLDAPMKLVFAACLCMHWFNPLVLLMFILYNRDVELACDERVVKELGQDARAEYATLLLTMQEARGPLSPLASSLSRYSLKERIISVMKYKKTSALAVLLSLILVTTIGLGFATRAEQSPDGFTLRGGWIDTAPAYSNAMSRHMLSAEESGPLLALLRALTPDETAAPPEGFTQYTLGLRLAQGAAMRSDVLQIFEGSDIALLSSGSGSAMDDPTSGQPVRLTPGQRDQCDALYYRYRYLYRYLTPDPMPPETQLNLVGDFRAAMRAGKISGLNSVAEESDWALWDCSYQDEKYVRVLLFTQNDLGIRQPIGWLPDGSFEAFEPAPGPDGRQPILSKGDLISIGYDRFQPPWFQPSYGTTIKVRSGAEANSASLTVKVLRNISGRHAPVTASLQELPYTSGISYGEAYDAKRKTYAHIFRFVYEQPEGLAPLYIGVTANEQIEDIAFSAETKALLDGCNWIERGAITQTDPE